MLLATKEQTSQSSDIRFSVIKVIDSFNKVNVLYWEATSELSSLKNDEDRRAVQCGGGFDSKANSTRSRREKSQEFSQDNKGIGKNILLHVLSQEIFYQT